jgi:hypothetical protein
MTDFQIFGWAASHSAKSAAAAQNLHHFSFE